MKITMFLLLTMLIFTPHSASAELITGSLEGIPESQSFSWGDGINDLFQEWSMNNANSSGWFYGSSYYNSNADVYVYAGLNDPTTITDASVFDYWDSSSQTYPAPEPYGLSWAAWAQEGDTVFFRGVNGKYGAWQIENIENGNLYGIWYFIDDGAADFSKEKNIASPQIIPIIQLLLLNRK